MREDLMNNRPETPGEPGRDSAEKASRGRSRKKPGSRGKEQPSAAGTAGEGTDRGQTGAEGSQSQAAGAKRSQAQAAAAEGSQSQAAGAGSGRPQTGTALPPSDQPDSPPSKGKKRAVRAGAAAAAAAVVLAGAYIYIGTTYRNAFFNGTVINGMNVSGKTADEVKEMISQGTEDYVLTLTERGGQTESIEGESIGLKAEFDGTLEQLLAEQNPYGWLAAWIQGRDYELPALVSYDEGRLESAVRNLDCMDENRVQKPENARISQYVSGEGYHITEETEGNEADFDRLKEAVAQAVSGLQRELSLEKAGVYMEPEVRSDDEGLKQLLEQYNRYAGVTVTYTFGDQKEVLDGDTISQWLYDDGSQVIISEEAAGEYVQTLATKYNTAYRAKSLKTSYGPTVTISKGNYGWRINQPQERAGLLEMIRAGESGTREPVYSQKAARRGENDYGDTYVEINLTAQHLFFYKDGKLLVESDFVSGNESKGWSTPSGAYPLTYKERNATLKGEGYRTPVSYWMPFNGGIGLHDASWRSSFGGTIYKTNGSHGCVNLPPAVAKTIYENISQGDPVLCYELAGTEQSVTTNAGGRPEQTKPAETKPAETQPAETSPAPTQPAETKPAETSPAPTQPAETKPAETSPAPTQPAETEPAETSPAPTQPAETRPAGPGESSAGGSSGTEAVGPGAGLQ